MLLLVLQICSFLVLNGFHPMAIPDFVYFLSIKGHLSFSSSCYLNNAAMNIGIQVFPWTYDLFLLGKYLGVELLGHM